MSSKNLKQSNPYLADPMKRKKGLWKTVASSTAIEGIQVAKDKVVAKSPKAATRRRKTSKSAK
jgi:hypothetical protein